MDTNVGSVYNCCHFAIPHMVHEKCGKIINISSVWGLQVQAAKPHTVLLKELLMP